MRLNRYLAQCGVASRRQADELIRAATTTVNGKLVVDPAYQVQAGDQVFYDGRRLEIVAQTRILMLNKPTGVITSVSDERGRKTVMDLIPGKERLFPVGRLDKDTTGLLLLTNDGDLANRLAHPRWGIPRIYAVEIDRPLEKDECTKMERGIYIGENEFGRARMVQQATVKTRTTVILELKRGKKREIRRLFYRLDRKIYSLARTAFGPLEIGELPLGRWRQLTQREIEQLKGSIHGYQG